MQLNNTLEVMNHLITLLAAEGVKAYIGKIKPEYADEEPEDGLRIPAWENDKEELSREAIYKFIFSKLAANPRKGLVTEVPGVPHTLNVYTIDPAKLDDGAEVNCWDVLVWSSGDTLESFTWEECVIGDDAAWWEGWDLPRSLEMLPTRVGNLLIFLHNSLVDLPPVQPFTEGELIEKLKSKGTGGEMYCESLEHRDEWRLRLSPEGSLVMHKKSDDSLTPITGEHINDTGGVVLDGRTIMHRSWNY